MKRLELKDDLPKGHIGCTVQVNYTEAVDADGQLQGHVCFMVSDGRGHNCAIQCPATSDGCPAFFCGLVELGTKGGRLLVEKVQPGYESLGQAPEIGHEEMGSVLEWVKVDKLRFYKEVVGLST
ncbi:hypothetical protein AK812_SmicGene20757 [Symbiodinium microadriaticum]|uniref:Uncharacterized protein n=1 Tax=Symbiodinium microadriaticum TaxID=2951 RepID=A0A1Q9DP78_SYMMI|nr:hypothetical protein AK812_SmicGene20757 [Symbiodinium microadriaticum]